MTFGRWAALEEDALEQGIRRRYRDLLRRVEEACLRSGRHPREVRVVAVSKNRTLREIEAAWRAGMREFGENRAQELAEKLGGAPPAISWHFIGHLQTNKVKIATGKVALIHSVDSLRLAEAIGREASRQGIVQEVLLQLNISEEPTKHGFRPEELEEALLNMKDIRGIRVRGLMTMAALTGDEGEIRRCFRTLRERRDEAVHRFPGLSLDLLSMGMSNDFEIAVEEGANLLRIGTAIFQEGA